VKRNAAEIYINESSAEERFEFVERAQMVVAFLAGPGSPVSLAVSKHLPVFSNFMADFGEKMQRFIGENPELMRRMMGPQK